MNAGGLLMASLPGRESQPNQSCALGEIHMRIGERSNLGWRADLRGRRSFRRRVLSLSGFKGTARCCDVLHKGHFATVKAHAIDRARTMGLVRTARM